MSLWTIVIQVTQLITFVDFQERGSASEARRDDNEGKDQGEQGKD